jgi:glycine oxidase
MSVVEHVVVIGGGVAGCAAAYELGKAGARVTLVEREGVGSQSSGWSAGGLNPLQGIPASIADFAMASYRLHLEFWPELERLAGSGFGARLISMALVAPDEAAIPALLEIRDVFTEIDGFSARWLDAAELRSLEPRIAPDVAGALLTDGNGVVDSHAFTAALATAAQHHGATLRAGTVTGIRHADRHVTGVALADGDIPCDAVVLAMGPWSGAAGDWLDCPLPIEPLKGEIVRVAPAGPPLACDVVAPSVSLFGRADGQVWIGATQERRGFDAQPSESAYRTLVGAAVRLMPSLAEARLVRQTACLRPVTPDGLPVVGKLPDWQGVYVATGGGPKGILLAPAMGRAISDLVRTGRTTLPINACSPERFLGANVL